MCSNETFGLLPQQKKHLAIYKLNVNLLAQSESEAVDVSSVSIRRCFIKGNARNHGSDSQTRCG